MANTFNPAAGQAPTSNNDAVATLTAPTDGTRWELQSISYSYSAAPASATLVIAWGAYSETYYITAGGPGILAWPQPRRFPTNTAVTITLKAGGNSISGTVYPQATTGR